eukprot:2160608-Amphidinium_carterae.1
MKGIPLEFGEFGDMPYYKRVPESHRTRRFQMNKLKIMTKDCEEEAEANRRRAIAEQEEIDKVIREAGNATRHITADAPYTIRCRPPPCLGAKCLMIHSQIY